MQLPSDKIEHKRRIKSWKDVNALLHWAEATAAIMSTPSDGDCVGSVHVMTLSKTNSLALA